MGVLPTARFAFPDPGLFRGSRLLKGTVFVDRLRQTDVRHDCHIAVDPDIRRAHRDVLGALGDGRLRKVILMKRQAGDQLSASLGFEAGDFGITQFGVGFPVSGDDGIQELLIQRDDFRGRIRHLHSRLLEVVEQILERFIRSLLVPWITAVRRRSGK